MVDGLVGERKKKMDFGNRYRNKGICIEELKEVQNEALQ